MDLKLNLIQSSKTFALATSFATLTLATALADERRFTYTYEPEVLPKGGMEFEQWVTLGTQRTSAGSVQEKNYNRFDLREEFEYGVTDRYSVSLYLNTSNESFRDPSTGVSNSDFSFEGISLENRYLLINPADHAVGLTLYLEPRFSGDEFELEQKIILGQRHGNWKWALNLTHAIEWKDSLHDREGEVEASFGVARDFGSHWSVGIEARDHNEIPDYARWENTALFVGPVVSYRQDKWYAALSALPQVFGRNYIDNPDGYRNLELEAHERLSVRFILGINL